MDAGYQIRLQAKSSTVTRMLLPRNHQIMMLGQTGFLIMETVLLYLHSIRISVIRLSSLKSEQVTQIVQGKLSTRSQRPSLVWKSKVCTSSPV